jgi:hypothetical protein
MWESNQELHVMPAYTEQFRRVKRYLARIENQSRDSTDYDDDLWSFFQNCWHLKDWIKNDPDISASVSEQIEDIVDNHPNIVICADLANGTKHSRLDRKGRVGAQFTERNVTVHLGNPTTSESEHIITLQDGTQVVALDVAKKAVEEWQTIFATHGLQT